MYISVLMVQMVVFFWTHELCIWSFVHSSQHLRRNLPDWSGTNGKCQKATVQMHCITFLLQILTAVGDVTKEEDCKKIVDKTLEKFGRIDVVVYNCLHFQKKDSGL